MPPIALTLPPIDLTLPPIALALLTLIHCSNVHVHVHVTFSRYSLKFTTFIEVSLLVFPLFIIQVLLIISLFVNIYYLQLSQSTSIPLIYYPGTTYYIPICYYY